MSTDKAILYRAEKLDNLLVFQANYRHFQFSRHSHEDFALGLMEHGAQKFHCRGREFCAPAGSLITVNPDEIHDGQSANNAVYRYRIVYLPFSQIQEIGAATVAPRTNHYFRTPVTVDSELARQLAYVFGLLDRTGRDTLEIQSIFYNLLSRLLIRHGTEHERIPYKQPVPQAITRACDYIHEMAREKNISLDDISAAAGLSRYHFLRIFTASQGISPYSFLLHRRLQLARESIARGFPLADAAIDAGFADQSHLTRRFKSAFGITPRQYQKAVT